MHNNSFDRFKEWQSENYENMKPLGMEGDVLLLQLINTKRLRQGPQIKDYLKNYQDFMVWSYRFGLIDEAMYDTLSLEGYGDERAAEKSFRKVIGIRESMYRLMLNFLHNRPIPQEELKVFNEITDEANKNLHFTVTEQGLQRTWKKVHDELEFPLWKLVKPAGAFLLSKDLKQVKMCDCGNFFLDNSRRKNRSWCSTSCGSSHWSRTYYERKKLDGELAMVSGG